MVQGSEKGSGFGIRFRVRNQVQGSESGSRFGISLGFGVSFRVRSWALRGSVGPSRATSVEVVWRPAQVVLKSRVRADGAIGQMQQLGKFCCAQILFIESVPN